jgi:hypothetical protein
MKILKISKFLDSKDNRSFVIEIIAGGFVYAWRFYENFLFDYSLNMQILNKN